jgi:hypothetical protein
MKGRMLSSQTVTEILDEFQRNRLMQSHNLVKGTFFMSGISFMNWKEN